MKITDIRTFVVTHKLGDNQRFAYSQNWYNERTILLLKMITDTGIVGWGESFGPARVHKTIIDTIYSPVVIGRDPFDTSVIWEELYNKLRDHGQKGLSIEAISAIDIAMWDIKGQACGLPVYKLLGGAFHKQIIPYATGLYRRKIGHGISELISEAQGYAEQGFSAIKIKIGFGVEDDICVIKELRKALGDEIKLMIDANHAYNACTAISLGKRIQEYNITWFEEPVPPEDIEGYKEVRANIDIPIAGGEAEFTRYGFNRLLSERAVDIVQPDCCVTGGISEFMKIATIAGIHGIRIFPHVWGSAIAVQTGIHCAFSIPHCPPSLVPEPILLELDRTPNIFREELARNKLQIHDGTISTPDKPGLGLDIDEELIAKYSVS